MNSGQAAEIPLLAPGEKRTPTFYHRRGDWFGWGCVGLAAITFVLRLRRLKRDAKSQ